MDSTPARSLPANVDVGIAVAVAIVLAVESVFSPAATNPVRVVLGLLEGLILPGYLLVYVLFPRRESLRGFERWGLILGVNAILVLLASLGLSVAAIRFDVRSATLTLSILTGLFAVAVVWRRRSFPRSGAQRLPVPSGATPWLVFTFATVLAVATWSVADRNLSSAQPEFSVTGLHGQLQNYPYEVPVGTRYLLRVNLDNPTDHAVRYRVIIGDTHDGHIGGQALAVVAKSRWTTVFALPSGPPVRQERVSFNLYDKGRLVRTLWVRYRIVS